MVCVVLWLIAARLWILIYPLYRAQMKAISQGNYDKKNRKYEYYERIIFYSVLATVVFLLFLFLPLKDFF